jgi:hypothetical protein
MSLDGSARVLATSLKRDHLRNGWTKADLRVANV